MADDLPRYWQSLTARSGELVPVKDEFPEELPVGPVKELTSTDRRGFFRLMGLSAAAGLAACNRAPVQKVIPFLTQPEGLIPGLALHYASVCGGCAAGCGVLLKTRDGRPIKVEGNDEHPLTRGGTCAKGQAVVLSLYDADRAKGPSFAGKASSWASLDAAVTSGLGAVKKAGAAIRLVLPWRVGPSAEAAVKSFLEAFPTARTVRDEPASPFAAIALGHQKTHGVRAVPSYRFELAKVVASFGADFQGGWLSPVEHTRAHATARDALVKRSMSRHFQLEAAMSLTGTNADRRILLAPSDEAFALGALVHKLAANSKHLDRERIAAAANPFALGEAAVALEQSLDEIAAALTAAGPAGLVISGSDLPQVQALANAANELLGAYGHTVRLDLAAPLDPTALTLDELLAELRAGTVGAVVLAGGNPVYSHPRGEELGALLAKTGLTVSTADRLDETASLASHHAPGHNPLEDWGDAEPQRGLIGLRQPGIRPLFDTRGAFESLLLWAGAKQPWYDFVRARWQREVQVPWDESVQRGFAQLPSAAPAAAFSAEGLLAALGSPPPAGEGDELVLFPPVGVGDGSLGNNGWLQELPDPITKATWGNYLLVPPSRAAKEGIVDGQVVTVSSGDRQVTLPALVQPGLHPRTLALALGYGRSKAGRVGNGVGKNASPLAAASKSALFAAGVKLTVTPEVRVIAQTQTHASLEGRPHVQEATLEEFLANPHAGAEAHGPGHTRRSMWSGHTFAGNRWGLVVNLSACTGCSACVVACQAENNIAVVGEDEVRRKRDMAWMRIDRYYAGPPENPEVVHQPMMCQHCENAPCETVCPVLATLHSSDGLNQQVYNRCVGTRYCANNCPTKVRRFNWFENPHPDPLERMVLNPDVVVRSRGVMEKCSMCVQRIDEVRALAKREGRPVADREIRTACQQSCPAAAISFGDLNDPKSEVAHLASDGRNYRVLEELNVGPAVSYLTRIKNPGAKERP
ncbi:MAG: Fe-S-cluster-containing hydrogenase [Myxococcaceae bacterium]